ncbi:MAG TPA: hypothetical protein VF783_14120 [Terriglobales bacterium]
MARKPNEMPVEEQKPSGKFVLKKNHGMVIAGKSHAFYPAGTELDPATDAALIFQLVQSGAQFE